MFLFTEDEYNNETTCSRKKSLIRSSSAPIPIVESFKRVPRVTISDFDDNVAAADMIEEAANDVTYVTLEDVKQFTAANTLKHSRLVQVQSYSDFDTWSCTNSSVCTEDGFSDPELEREVLHQDLQQPKKVGS